MKPTKETPHLIGSEPSDGISRELLALLRRIERLKQIPRTGWALRGVRRHDSDSVAEHSTLTGIIGVIIGYLIQKTGTPINIEAIAKYALFHDLAEIVIGDLDRENLKIFGDDFRTRKHLAEQKVLIDLFAPIGGIPDLGANIQAALAEDSIEAQVLKVSDKLEACLQAFSFIESGYSRDLFASFFKDLTAIQEKLPWRPIQDLIKAVLRTYEEI